MALSKKICFVAGCGKLARTKQLCVKHYHRLHRHGDPLGGAPFRGLGLVRTCVIEGCSNKVNCKNLCQMHYLRLKKHGDPLIGASKNDGRQKHPSYSVWRSMVFRCRSRNVKDRINYVERGIDVCSRWKNDFWAFVKDMGERPSRRHTIGRIDNDGDYRPGNCEWQTYAQQNRNHRRNNLVTIGGRTQVLNDWAIEKNISASAIYGRLKRGWSMHDAIMMPPIKRYWEVFCNRDEVKK